MMNASQVLRNYQDGLLTFEEAYRGINNCGYVLGPSLPPVGALEAYDPRAQKSVYIVAAI